jgi:hypothetical protein
MTLKIQAICPRGHLLNASLAGMPDTHSLNMAAVIRLEGTCPTCGTEPIQAPIGYYELDDEGILKRVGGYRP